MTLPTLPESATPASIGQMLKEARTRKAATLEDVHAKIRIHPRILVLLEEEKFDKLPSPLFAKSFLRSYAEFLELNADDLVSVYEKVVGGRPAPQQTIYIPPADERNKRPSNSKKSYWVPVFLIVSAVILSFVVYDVLKTLKVWNLKPTKASVATHAPAPSAIAVKAKIPTAQKTAAWIRSVEQGNFPKIPKKQALELQVKAIDDVWMRVTCDGKVLYEAILKRAATESWSAQERIEIWTGNSSYMQLNLNQTSLGSLGKGVVRKMLITRDGVRVPQK